MTPSVLRLEVTHAVTVLSARLSVREPRDGTDTSHSEPTAKQVGCSSKINQVIFRVLPLSRLAFKLAVTLE